MKKDAKLEKLYRKALKEVAKDAREISGGKIKPHLKVAVKSHATRLAKVRRSLGYTPKDEEERKFWAVRIDETQYLNLSQIKEETGLKTIPKLYSVYITDLARVHIASLTASAELHLIYHYFDYRGDNEETRETLDSLAIDITYDSELVTYSNWNQIDKIAKSKNGTMIGEFESYDDAQEYAQGNTPF